MCGVLVPNSENLQLDSTFSFRSIVLSLVEYYSRYTVGRNNGMLKKLLLVLILALNFAAAANVTVNHVPWPDCFPCDDTPNPN